MLEKKKMAQFWEGGLYFARQSYPQPTLISKNGGVYEAHDRTRCHFTFTCAAPSFTCCFLYIFYILNISFSQGFLLNLKKKLRRDNKSKAHQHAHFFFLLFLL